MDTALREIPKNKECLIVFSVDDSEHRRSFPIDALSWIMIDIGSGDTLFQKEVRFVGSDTSFSIGSISFSSDSIRWLLRFALTELSCVVHQYLFRNPGFVCSVFYRHTAEGMCRFSRS